VLYIEKCNRIYWE